MKVAGIIAEYNPFHKGHQYHIEETRRLTGADYVVVVMSGDYVQRGEPACVDKYLRSRMALEGGADVVIEMPVIYATASAEYFATAGVGILDQLGCVDYLSFGSEWADVETLTRIAKILLEEPPAYKETLKRHLEEGCNFPQARERAVMACFPDERIMRVLSTPNHILGIEYIKALLRRNSEIQPIAIPRKGAGYLDEKWESSAQAYPSATALRKVLFQGEKEPDAASLREAIPFETEELLELLRRGDYASWKDLMPYLDYMVLMKRKVLGKYFGMDLDISRRIRKNYQPGGTFQDVVEMCHSRNYTDAALRRMLLHVVLQMKEYPFLMTASEIPLPYARILGLRKTAGKLVSRMKLQRDFFVFQRSVEGKELKEADMVGHTLYEMDVRCADFYEQIAAVKAGRDARSEYVRTSVIL